MKKLLFILAFTICTATYASAEDISMDKVTLGTLDKITGRTGTITTKVNEITHFGSLLIKVDVCKTRPPEETPENAAFLEIVKLSKKKNTGSKIFSGWMFSSSPALSALDDPTYDVWVIKCTGNKTNNSTTPVTPNVSEQATENEPVVTIENEEENKPQTPSDEERTSDEQTDEDESGTESNYNSFFSTSDNNEPSQKPN